MSTRGLLLIGYDVNCGKCGTFKHVFPAVRNRNRQDILAHLFRDGWKKTNKYGWICDMCADRKDKKESEC